MKRKTIIEIARFLLILLWVYTAGSKLAEFQEFKRQISGQIFPKEWSMVLVVLVPLVELVAAGLLLFHQTLIKGFTLSTVLMVCFTVYVGLAVFGFYEKKPCSCGGVISSMGWLSHFYFNLFFTAVAVIGQILTIKERRQEKL